MYEATTIDAKRNAIQRAHEARGRAAADLVRSIFGAPRARQDRAPRRALFSFF